MLKANDALKKSVPLITLVPAASGTASEVTITITRNAS